MVNTEAVLQQGGAAEERRGKDDRIFSQAGLFYLACGVFFFLVTAAELIYSHLISKNASFFYSIFYYDFFNNYMVPYQHYIRLFTQLPLILVLLLICFSIRKKIRRSGRAQPLQLYDISCLILLFCYLFSFGAGSGSNYFCSSTIRVLPIAGAGLCLVLLGVFRKKLFLKITSAVYLLGYLVLMLFSKSTNEFVAHLKAGMGFSQLLIVLPDKDLFSLVLFLAYTFLGYLLLSGSCLYLRFAKSKAGRQSAAFLQTGFVSAQDRIAFSKTGWFFLGIGLISFSAMLLEVRVMDAILSSSFATELQNNTLRLLGLRLGLQAAFLLPAVVLFFVFRLVIMKPSGSRGALQLLDFCAFCIFVSLLFLPLSPESPVFSELNAVDSFGIRQTMMVLAAGIGMYVTGVCFQDRLLKAAAPAYLASFATAMFANNSMSLYALLHWKRPDILERQFGGYMIWILLFYLFPLVGYGIWVVGTLRLKRKAAEVASTPAPEILSSPPDMTAAG